ncbi:OmpA family protein [Rugamonas sp. CCM 8940]|uniref:OmpA family protein n=1 Tax=Rugamonas sp. CCM 8940 TaxID=2765359 RepID=UPI0018F5358F|nr:OmpA family protein [Rugamonas sp. CCM 8940]MBJ7309598.1 OmpA family protein [Rugamonas sp. CCM 8940]
MSPSLPFRRRVLRAALLPLLATLTLAACQSAPPAPPPRFNASQVAMFRELGFSQTDEGWELSFAEKLLFDFDAHKLNGPSRVAVGKVSAALRSVGIGHLRVEGHTDGAGSDAYNNKLSLQRANAVADAMSEAGIQREDIVALGHGKNNPVADNATAAGRAENRRVAIIVLAP